MRVRWLSRSVHTHPVNDGICILDEAVASVFGEPELTELPRHDAGGADLSVLGEIVVRDTYPPCLVSRASCTHLGYISVLFSAIYVRAQITSRRVMKPLPSPPKPNSSRITGLLARLAAALVSEE